MQNNRVNSKNKGLQNSEFLEKNKLNSAKNKLEAKLKQYDRKQDMIGFKNKPLTEFK